MIRRLRRRFDGKGMMIRRSVWTTMAVAISAVLVSACGKPTDRYLGTWQDVRNPARTLVIQENGQEFLAKDIDDTPSAFACKDLGKNLFSGHIQQCPDHRVSTVILKAEGDILKNVEPLPLGLGISTIVVDASSGQLIVGSSRYKRVGY